MRRHIIFFTLSLFALTALAKDIKTVVVSVTPQMHCESCEEKIKKNIRFEKGVKEIETSIADQTVTIRYDAEKTTPAKICEGFKKIGYDAEIKEEKNNKE